MDQSLIIIRGNSGCGKSTIAKKLQLEMGHKTMLVPQDTVCRGILRVNDNNRNPSIQLIYDIVMYGKKIGYNVIIEGILSKKKYGSMLNKLIKQFDNNVFIYYFDISFEETLIRHASRLKADNFGEKEMKEWWEDNDRLGFKGEKDITENMSEDQILKMILSDIL